MAKFTKLNIGDSVASSGGRVWKKLSAEEEVTLEGTWLVNSGWSCPAGYGFWTFNGYTQKVGASNTWSTSSGIFFGYEETMEFIGTTKENAILVGYDIYGHLYPQDSFYLVIEEEPEDNDGKLSTWLKSNATKQTTTSSFSVYNGSTLIGTFEYLDSMTWREFVNSDYNPDYNYTPSYKRFYFGDTTAENPSVLFNSSGSGIYVRLSNAGSIVKADDEIIEGFDYNIGSGSGGGAN